MKIRYWVISELFEPEFVTEARWTDAGVACRCKQNPSRIAGHKMDEEEECEKADQAEGYQRVP